MKIFNKNSIAAIAAVSVVFSAIISFGLGRPISVYAATSPSLGAADTYSVLAGSQVTNIGATAISGDVGISPGIGVAPHYTGFGTVTLGGTMHDADAAALAAQGAINTVYTTNLNQACATDYGAVTKELAGETLAPGVYCANSFHLSSGTLTLNGGASDVWIFKSASDLIITGGSSAKVVFTGGGLPCNVWWRVASTATFDVNSSFVGNILADTSITLASGVNLNGRALAQTAEVTLSNSSITGPTCTTPASPIYSENNNTITVFKQVINDNGGTAKYSDFLLYIDGIRVVSGQSLSLAPGVYTVSEINFPGYTTTFTGNCDANGKVNHGGLGTHNDICTVVNDDIGTPLVAPVPPLIDVVKVPSPLALPAGPGLVTYTYTVKNIGTVPMTDVTLIGDTCSPITLSSGDTNGDLKLDMEETWIYNCAKTLTKTTTNTVVATGHANGLNAVDVASATVIVGSPIVPPLIHVTKLPNPLILPSGTGTVTYTNKVTNPGTVALSNVSVADDKCSPSSYVSGDADNDSKLDTAETWVYTCQTILAKTTTNTVTVTGSANGLTATDFALATVAVAVPKLPNTGFAPEVKITPWGFAILFGIFALVANYLVRRKRTI